MSNAFETHLRGAFEKKELSPKSVSLYMKNLERLNDGRPLTDFRFLENPATIEQKLADYADTTRRNFIIAIVSALNLGGSTPKHKKLYTYYYNMMINMNKEIKDKPKKTGEGLPTWGDILTIFNSLYVKAEELPRKGVLTDKEYTLLLKAICASLYVLIPPRRNGDYLDMCMVYGLPKEATDDKNYLDTKSWEFVFNKYKTSKTYGEYKTSVPPRLKSLISLYLLHHPILSAIKTKKERDTSICRPFLVYKDGEPLTQINAITRILNSVFGKGVGSSQLRHIYLTEKYGAVEAAKQADAAAMGHSVLQQGDYIYQQ
jgi:hypothetical protein|nr:MAG: hypothetical protein [Lake Baikal virophage 7]